MSIQLIDRKIKLYLNRGTPGVATVDGAQEFTNKTIDLASNTVTGTKAQFNTALTDGDFAYVGDVQPLDADLTAIAALSGTTGLLRKTAADTWTLDTAAYQAADADLTAIAALAGTLGFLRKTAADTWTLDTATYQTAQSVTGIVKSTGTTRSAAVAGTDFVAPGGALGTPSSGNLSNCTADGTSPVGFRNIPQVSQSANYTCVLTDANKHLLHPAADTTARTFTIPANASVAYPTGTTITFVNQNGAGVITIAINTDVMRKVGDGTTGNRTLPANRNATAIKITATEWQISGAD